MCMPNHTPFTKHVVHTTTYHGSNYEAWLLRPFGGPEPALVEWRNYATGRRITDHIMLNALWVSYFTAHSAAVADAYSE